MGQDALLQTSALIIEEVLGDSECHFWSGSLCTVRQVVVQVVRQLRKPRVVGGSTFHSDVHLLPSCDSIWRSAFGGPLVVRDWHSHVSIFSQRSVINCSLVISYEFNSLWSCCDEWDTFLPLRCSITINLNGVSEPQDSMSGTLMSMLRAVSLTWILKHSEILVRNRGAVIQFALDYLISL